MTTKPKKSGEEPPSVAAEPTEETLRKAITICEDPCYGVVSLVGKTQDGKSTFWRHIAAQRAGLADKFTMGQIIRAKPKDIGLTVINLQNELPEDFSGWPKDTTTAAVMAYAIGRLAEAWGDREQLVQVAKDIRRAAKQHSPRSILHLPEQMTDQTRECNSHPNFSDVASPSEPS